MKGKATGQPGNRREGTMCGIAGIYHFDPERKVDEGLLRRMTTLLRHRGPDDEGFFVNGNAGLGHRRLAIIDLVTGHQPMSNRDSSLWLVVNGEIYNFRELRDELSSLGHTFSTKSDSEVIIHSYEEWGVDCINRFNGMFAFALLDLKRRRLVLARDRLGIKPLYYSIVDDTVIFASEVKSILLYPGIDRDPDPVAISQYLGYRSPLGRRTMFKGIEKLPAGHLMIVERNRIKEIEYWDIPIQKEKRDRGEEYYKSRIRSLLSESVKRRMISDVPFGAYLSGGLDSSIVVALMAQQTDDPVKTYTIRFEEEGFDETRYAREVADRYGTEHHEIHVREDHNVELIRKLISFKDAPLSVANEVPLHIMSRELKKDITVVLSGEGADELFAGYGRIFRSPFDYERVLLFNESSDLPLEFREEFIKKIKRLYGKESFDGEVDHFLSKYHWLSFEDRETILSEDLLDEINGDTETLDYFAEKFDRARDLSHYERIAYVFQRIHLEGLLMRVDMTTMATAVEARVPFVDHELVEFVFNIPFHYKLRWKSPVHMALSGLLTSDEISEKLDIPKYILRETFKEMLPESIIRRKKMGFPVPLNRWFKGKYIKSVKDVLLDGETASRGIFNMRAVEKWLRSEKTDEHSFSLKLWMLFNLELWFREYVDGWSGDSDSRKTGITVETAAGA